MTAGRKAYLVVAIAFVFLGPLGAIGCFCPQPMPFFFLGLWMIVGFAWTRTAFLAAHLLTGATFAVVQIVVFTSGAGTARNLSDWHEHAYRVGLIAAGVAGLISFGAAVAVEHARRIRSGA